MKLYQGKCIIPGIAIGPVYMIQQQNREISRNTVENPEKEIQRFLKAKSAAVKQLEMLYNKTRLKIGEKEALIFQSHQMIIEDLDFINKVVNMISSDKVDAEYAVTVVGKEFAEIFGQMDDEYIRARAVDVIDASQSIVSVLRGCNITDLHIEKPVIIVAEDLAPSEVVRFDKHKILAFVTKKGSANSHTAILARMINVPFIIVDGIQLNPEINNKQAIVDGHTGEFILEPDTGKIQIYKAKQEEERKKIASLAKLKGADTVTKSGKKIKLYANIGGPDDLDMVLANDAEGIGLFRSEFLYLGRNDYPSEEEQYQAFKEVISKMKGKKTIIRTLDIGSDKQASYFDLPREANPAMGFRAIRICLQKVDIFKTQLRAIYRAAVYGNTAVMFPMITSIDEIRKIKEIIKEVKEELKNKKANFGEAELGIMIETPAAVMISDELAKEVDFFSIGTNDLVQYTLAVDRQNQSLEHYYNHNHKAVMRMIKMTIDNAHDAGIWCGICGEMAADLEMTEELIRLGVDELSVSPAFILPLREKIINID